MPVTGKGVRLGSVWLKVRDGTRPLNRGRFYADSGRTDVFAFNDWVYDAEVVPVGFWQLTQVCPNGTFVAPPQGQEAAWKDASGRLMPVQPTGRPAPLAPRTMYVEFGDLAWRWPDTQPLAQAVANAQAVRSAVLLANMGVTPANGRGGTEPYTIRFEWWLQWYPANAADRRPVGMPVDGAPIDIMTSFAIRLG